MGSSRDLHSMRSCLESAMRGRPSPNPFVGAVIVYGDKIIGEGYHKAAGQPHAEVEAIREVQRRHGATQSHYLLSRSTLYVNLEPCNHFGKQPPCTHAIIKAGIRRVVFAMKDVNKAVEGKGAEKLRKAGIEVIAGVLENEARAINAPFIHNMSEHRAFVTLKMAMSKDGKMASESKRNRFISSPASRKLVQRMRDKAPAIMVGIGTVKADNPKLTCRIRGGHDPLRIIVDQKLEIDERARVLHDRNVLLVCAKPREKEQKKKFVRLKRKGLGIFEAPVRKDGFLHLEPLLAHLAAMGIDHVLLEGGPGLAQDMIEHKLVDEIVLFRSQKRVGKTVLRPAMMKAIACIKKAAKSGVVKTYRPQKGPDSIQISMISESHAGSKKTKHSGKTRHSFWTSFFGA